MSMINHFRESGERKWKSSRWTISQRGTGNCELILVSVMLGHRNIILVALLCCQSSTSWYMYSYSKSPAPDNKLRYLPRIAEATHLYRLAECATGLRVCIAIWHLGHHGHISKSMQLKVRVLIKT